MDPWINLRSLLDAVSRDTEMSRLDERSQRLLEWVVAHHNPELPTFVQAIVTGSNVASPATVHKCLSVLEREGLLHFTVDTLDTRRRIVTPTEKAYRLYEQLNNKVTQWASQFKTN